MAVRRGILSYGAYVPFRRLDLAEITPVAGTGGGKGQRTVASYDEDTTTMAVEAARIALRAMAAGGTSAHASEPASVAGAEAPPGPSGAAAPPAPGSLWFATTAPAYADKTNATAIHAALSLDPAVPAFDVNGAVRSAVGALRAGLAFAAGSSWPALVIGADLRTGLPGSPDEAAGGDGAAALLVGEGTVDAAADASAGAGAPLLAELLGTGSVTDEFLDRWRTPGDDRSKLWEERFGEGRYLAAGQRAWDEALKSAGLVAEQVDRIVVAGSHTRATNRLAGKLGAGMAEKASAPSPLTGAVGFAGAAQPALELAAALDAAGPGEVIAQVVLADGADVLLWRTTDALATARPARSGRSVVDQVAAGGSVTYGAYLAWRGYLPVEPPRRPEPARPSASAAGRSATWKFGFVGSQAGDGTVHLPPAPQDDQVRPMAGATGTIATFTVDKLAYSPSPPVVFAVVDFDGGGRLPVELTDVAPDEVRIGGRVEMTFRRLFTADGIHNYFWKARPVRTAPPAGEGS
jgi:hydroxymethylglutaryl-CoA synthase